MALKSFLYYLTLEDGRSLTVVNGVVTATGTRTPLRNTPDGWQDKLIGWSRNLSRHGIVRNFSIPIGFVRDGAQILKDLLYKNGFEQKVYLVIQKLELEYGPPTYKWVYRYFYKGEIDLSTLEHDQDKVTVSIMEGGMSKLLKANEATVYDIPLNDGFIFVRMGGINQAYSWTALVPAGQSVPGTGIRYMGMFESAREGTIPDVTFKDIVHTAAGAYPNDDYFMSVGRELTVRIHGTVNIHYTQDMFPILRLEVNDGVTTANTQYVLYDTPGTAGQDVVANIDQTVTIPAGHRLHMKIFGGDPVDPTEQFRIDGGELIVDYEFAASETFVKAYKPLTFFKRLVEKITGDQNNGESDLLTAKENLVVTCGDAIRGVTAFEPKIKSSFNNFYSSYDAILNIGAGIENEKIRLEEKAYFYDASNPIDLGASKDLKVSVASDLITNTVKIGYPEPQTLDTNGKYSFNGTHQYTSPITKIAKELSLISSYKADPYEIEIKRINLDGKATTDDKGDNDVCVLNIDPSSGNQVIQVTALFIAPNVINLPLSTDLIVGQKIQITGSLLNEGIYNILEVQSILFAKFITVDGTIVDETDIGIQLEFLSGTVYDLKRETYDDTEGIPDESVETIFNIEELTPKRLLLKHGNHIHANLMGLDTEKLKFQSTERNSGLKTELAGVIVDEDADVDISSLANKLYLPFYFDFETQVPINLVDLLEASTNRCFRFAWNGKTYTGFLIKASLAPNTRQQQQFKLLSTIDNDLTEFI